MLTDEIWPMLNYVRIAVTALSLTACVLLIALWIRSYWCWDSIGVSETEIHSLGSRIVITADLGQQDFLRARSTSVSLESLSSVYRLDNRWGFGLVNDSRNYVYVTPHWFSVLMAVIVAATPWMPRRFSLRTLLIATTLIAVGLGVIVRLATTLNDPLPEHHAIWFLPDAV
jgi:hypothetical protein